MEVNKMIKDAIYGFAVGDALGVPFEFKRRGTFKCIGMTGHGTWDQPAGTWSDDTSMMLATLDSIKQRGKIDIEDMRARFLAWWKDGEYTANGDTFDIGGTTARALTLGHGIDDINANGNGSLMRILPLAFIDSTGKQVARVSAITHAHEISTIGCRLYVAIAKGLINGEDMGSILARVAIMNEGPYKRLRDIQKLPEREIRSSGYVIDTLEAALWCVTTSNTYEETVLKAVNLGDDTDTTAAVAGGLAGIIYSFDAIPKEWITALRNKELIDRILN